jgi:hypothetical protein
MNETILQEEELARATTRNAREFFGLDSLNLLPKQFNQNNNNNNNNNNNTTS